MNPARVVSIIALAMLASGCAILPGGRKATMPETEWMSAPEAFQPYLRRLIRRVDIEWNREIAGLEKYPPPGSRVSIRFHINSAGLITRIDNVDENAGKAATYACLNAVTTSQPYPRWKKEMIAAIGSEQEITLSFYFHDGDTAARNPLPPVAAGD